MYSVLKHRAKRLRVWLFLCRRSGELKRLCFTLVAWAILMYVLVQQHGGNIRSLEREENSKRLARVMEEAMRQSELEQERLAFRGMDEEIAEPLQVVLALSNL